MKVSRMVIIMSRFWCAGSLRVLQDLPCFFFNSTIEEF